MIGPNAGTGTDQSRGPAKAATARSVWSGGWRLWGIASWESFGAARPLEIKCVGNKLRKAANIAVRHVPGYLCMLSNPSFPGIIKIGMITRAVAEKDH